MNQEEFVSRVEGSRQKLLKIARSMVRAEDCEDAVQSAILAAWEHLPQLRDEAAFDAWLRQILTNRCRQIQRGYKKEKDTYSALIDHPNQTVTDDSALKEALEALSDGQRKLIQMHHQQGYSLREMAAMMNQSEDVVKMRLYRARNRLRIILISLLLLVLLASAAVGTGVLDVSWFLKNRRAEPVAIEKPITSETVDVEYPGRLLDVSVNDAVWNDDELSLTFVYSIAGTDQQALIVHSGNIGVDGRRFDHIWTDEGIVPVLDWADGKRVYTFSVDGWRLDGLYLTGSADCLPDGLGQTFMAELHLDWIRPERYERLLDANAMLAFEAELVVKDYRSGEILEQQTVRIRVGAPALQEWREMYEAYNR